MLAPGPEQPDTFFFVQPALAKVVQIVQESSSGSADVSSRFHGKFSRANSYLARSSY